MQPENKYKAEDQFRREFFPDRKQYKNRFINPLAENLHSSILRSGFSNHFNFNSETKFASQSKTEKLFWYKYAEAIPEKYRTLRLNIRPFNDFCRTCIITDIEISKLAEADLKLNPLKNYFKTKPVDLPEFFTQLNYLIPVELKNLGFEIIRYEEEAEISLSHIKKLARAIHSRYLHEIRNQNTKPNSLSLLTTGKSDSVYVSDFDDLPEEIKSSNIDNAANIPTKLLSIGYKIRPVKKGFRSFALHLYEEEIETMARVEHLRWSWEKRLNGWTLSKVRDDNKKNHPGLIPYEDLSESEKEKDRELVRLIPAFLQDIDYEAFPISPDHIKKLSYAIKPQSSIHKILDQTRELNDQIRKLVILTPEVEEMVKIRNQTIEDAIDEIKESYNYAQHIQETFLPEDHEVREIFPDSFILYKPKDIVSGDFYFFSKRKNLIIFSVADCTGHGIPGALLSTLGYSILDQAVNEINLSDPSLILHHLYNKIHRYLRNDSEGSGISDDMDIILCTIETDTNILNYSSVKNSLYCISNGVLTEYRAQNTSRTNCDEGDCEFISTKVQLKTGDTLYLSSDGYPDQFGGKNHKKYRTARLRIVLQNLQRCSLPEQGDRLFEEIEKWREENNEDQTDDILLIGIRI
jgi:serine phosphatase RsbU (regulator of sigma subunit)